jgi:hypothetical protein
MRKMSVILAAAFIAGGCSVAMAQGAGGAGGAGGGGAGGGSEPSSTPRTLSGKQKPNAAVGGPTIMRRGDDMAPEFTRPSSMNGNWENTRSSSMNRNGY